MKTVVLCLVSVAYVALGSGCAPDSSVGSDSVPGAGAAGAASSQGGSGTSGAPSMATAGASGSPAAVAGSGGADTSVGGSGGSVGAMAGSGGTSGSGVAGGAGASVGGGNAMGGSAGQGGPSLCPVAGTTLCDGFETDAPGAGASAWTVAVATGDSMAVDTTKFYRGSKSMKFSAKSSAYIVTKKIFTGTTKATNNAFWGRYFILSNVAAAATYSQSHVVFGGLADAGNTLQFHFVGGSRGKLQAEIRLTNDAYTDNMTTPAAADPAFPLLADGWQCWEWQVTADDSFDFYINGTEVPEMKITAGKAVMSKATFAPLPIFGGLYLGWQSFSAGSAISGWIDEVAIGPNRIGCGS